MVHLLVLPHTVCDSSPKCGLHYVEVFGWKQFSPYQLRQASFNLDCHGLTVLYQLSHCCTDTTCCLHSV